MQSTLIDSSEEVSLFLDDVRRRALAVVPDWYPELRQALHHSLPQPLGALHVLPLLGTRCAGGAAQDATPLLVAWCCVVAATRILDDCADQDHPRALYRRVGMARANNLGAALLPLAHAVLAQQSTWPATLRDTILYDLRTTCLTLSAGQDLDLQQTSRSLERYLEIVSRKTCPMTAFALSAGVSLAVQDPEALEASRRCGHHLGYVLQLIDDLEAATHRDHEFGPGRPLTFPVLLAMQVAPDEQETIVAEATAPHPAAIRATLARHKVGTMMTQLLAQHRQRACQEAQHFGDPDYLDAWMTWVLRDSATLSARLDGETP